jgi:hypothetical protein
MNSVNNMSGAAKPKLTRPAVGKENHPDWILKLIKQQAQKENKYKKAHKQFASIYNEFLLMIEDINDQYGTSFTIQQALEEFHGEEAWEDDDGEE